jgi:hypothetical protein
MQRVKEHMLYRARTEEIEAFNVGKRQNMTREQIQQSLGKETEFPSRADRL